MSSVNSPKRLIVDGKLVRPVGNSAGEPTAFVFKGPRACQEVKKRRVRRSYAGAKLR